MSDIRECKFACPAELYQGHVVRGDAATDVENSDRFTQEAWTSGAFEEEQWVPKHKAAGCQLKVFNDGMELPIERVSRSRDITCVGPDSPACPALQGYHFVKKRVQGGRTTEVARK